MKTTTPRPEPVPSPAAPAWGAESTHPASGLTRILYADDDALLRKLGKLVLLRSGYEVDVVEDGAEAWAALNEVSYHLLITDHDMPHLTGRELITQARRAGMRLPIVMTSGSFNPLDNLAGAGSGLAVFLPKPFTSEMLVETVGQVLHTANGLRSGNGARTSVWAHSPPYAQPRLHGGINE